MFIFNMLYIPRVLGFVKFELNKMLKFSNCISKMFFNELEFAVFQWILEIIKWKEYLETKNN